MPISNNPMDSLRDVFDTAAQKTCEAFEQSRSYMERAKLRNALNDAYRRLGKAHYSAVTGDPEAYEQERILLAEVAELRQAYVDICHVIHKEQQGAGPFCTRCGKRNVEGNRFCSDCGAKL